jgi:diphthine synthase
MLHIIGTGLWKGDDISYRGVEICRSADKVYLDCYTRVFDKKELAVLEKIIGKKVVFVNRDELEEGLGFLKEAVKEDVVLLVPGDPLVATTHITIIEEAKKRKVKLEVVHGSSIYDALIGEAGLHIYKLGGSCTVPMREKQIKPYSVYDKLAENMKRGVHTLVFLDTTPEREMEVGEALEILQEIEKERKGGIASDKTKIIVGCRMGSEEQKLVYGEIGKLKKMKFRGPCTLIFPGKLHFSEEDYLKGLEC